MKNKLINIPQLTPGTTLVDTHCHLDMHGYRNDTASVVKRAADAGVTGILTVGIDLESSHKAIGLAKRFPDVWATIGIHPHNADSGNRETYQQLQMLARDSSNKVVGYGEIGLDFAKEYVPRKIQTETFDNQLVLAKKLNLPIIIHDRDAHSETLEILRLHAPYPSSGVMHCFSGDIHFANKVMDLGLYISIPGIVTFNNSKIMQQVAREIPLEKMIIETDGPFLAPVPYRGKTNKPEYLVYTAQKIAELRGISLDEVARQTTTNAQELFHIPQGETFQ